MGHLAGIIILQGLSREEPHQPPSRKALFVTYDDKYVRALT